MPRLPVDQLPHPTRLPPPHLHLRLTLYPLKPRTERAVYLTVAQISSPIAYPTLPVTTVKRLGELDVTVDYGRTERETAAHSDVARTQLFDVMVKQRPDVGLVS